MRKATKQRLMALFVLFIMAASSLAYVFSNFASPQTEIKPLVNFVVSGEIDPRTEDMYITNGFTFLKFYYNSETDPAMTTYMDKVPETFTTATGQQQVIVQKLEGDVTYMKIRNMNIENDFYNLTQDSVFTELCNNLVVLPTECALMNLNLTG
jgi:hypothetical protein